MYSAFVEKAIPMVSVDDKTGKYVITSQATTFLRALAGPIAIVSVAGLYRTGKSYLLNRMLLNRGNGFGVGPTVNPCTKGLWCWGTPIKGVSSDGESVNIVVIDTEGIGALDYDQTHDTKIFTLAILASSCFIYNSVGSIDETAVQNLSLVVNLTKHIQLKSSGGYYTDADQISNYFPYFYWVVRDFSLQLVDTTGNPISSKYYLEKALAPQNGFSDDVEEKNRIRRLLTTFFKERDCFTLIRPLVDETKLQHLDRLEHDELRPYFVDQVINFRKRVLNGIKIKTLQNKQLNGEMYCSMLSSYVGSINDGAVPNIYNAWNYMCEYQSTKAMSRCYEDFVQHVSELFHNHFPCPEEDFNSLMQQAEDNSEQKFRGQVLGEKSEFYLRELQGRLRKYIQERREENEQRAMEPIKEYITRGFKPLVKKLNSHEYKYYSEFDKEVNKIYEELLKSGPRLVNSKLKYLEAVKKFQYQGASFFFKSLKKEFERQAEMNKYKESQYTTEIEQLRTYKASDRKKFMYTINDSDQKISELSYRLEGLYSQLALTSKNKDEYEKKLYRSLAAKSNELYLLRKTLELKCAYLATQYSDENKKYLSYQKEWYKYKALIYHRVKQQQALIYYLQKKYRTLDSTLNISKLYMNNQLREMTEQFEKYRYELKRQLNYIVEKHQYLRYETDKLKYEKEEQNYKLDKKEKKFKEDLNCKIRELEKMKKEYYLEKKMMSDYFENARDGANKEQTDLSAKCSTLEASIRKMTEYNKRNKAKYEDDNAILAQQLYFVKEYYYDAKRSFQSQKNSLYLRIAAYEYKAGRDLYYSENQRINDLKNEYTQKMETLASGYYSEKKRMIYYLDNVMKKNGYLSYAFETAKQALEQRNAEFALTVESLRTESEQAKNQIRTLERYKSTSLLYKEHHYENRLRELYNEIYQIKYRAVGYQRESQRTSEDAIMQLKNYYEMGKMTLYKKLAMEKYRAEKKIKEIKEYCETARRNYIEALEEEKMELYEKLADLEEHSRSMAIDLQHEIDMTKKLGENLYKDLLEQKEISSRKEIEFSNKLYALALSAKQDKEKQEAKIEALMTENNKKEKEVMSLGHHRDQLANSLEKKETKVAELYAELSSSKADWVCTMYELKDRISEMSKEKFEKVTNLEKELALVQQEKEFTRTKMRYMERQLELSSQINEEKSRLWKEERENELRSVTERLTTERNKIEAKYRDFKNSVKESEGVLKKQITDLGKEKAVVEYKANHAELKVREAYERRTMYISALQVYMVRVKETLETTRRRSSEEIAQLKQTLYATYNARNELSVTLDRERILSQNKIKYTYYQRDNYRKEGYYKIQKLYTLLNNATYSRMQDKTLSDTQYNDKIIMIESNYRAKIQYQANEINKKTYDLESLVKVHETEMKTLKEQYHLERINREIQINSADKKTIELSELVRKLSDDVDRLRHEKEFKEAEHKRKEKEELDTHKEKTNSLYYKVKEAISQKQFQYFEYEKYRAKWDMERDNNERKVDELKEQVGKFERYVSKLQRDNERMKAERKNSQKTHSFIGRNTTFIEKPRLEEELNKENVGQQL